MSDTLERPDSETSPRFGRWQNVWRAIVSLTEAPGVAPIEVGSIIRVNHFHPSADVARTKAKREMDQVFARQGVFGTYDHCIEYLGPELAHGSDEPRLTEKTK